MKTDDLVNMLATGGGTMTATAIGRRYATSIGWGMLGAILLMLVLLRTRHDLVQATSLPMFWIKLAFSGALAGGSLFATMRLSRPGARLEWLPLAVFLPVLTIWTIATYSYFDAEPVERSKLLFGETWKICPLLIAMLSIPVFVAVIRAMRDLAPTRPRLAGFTAGLLSGAIAAVVYCLHCPEMGAPFIGVWYLLGILIPACIGALLGSALLRW
ncbi:MAG: DUF1109 domain-containing protein [Dechloromonas sp.]|jgi:hypothetical protein|nr:DUF1109 domain-containing protein [Candidatus Dechloromonas phosphoritropha]MBP8789369.1 DUF1109 domain-containing protein [Azonexus sp.]MBP9229747.1 DUF1109 domain-containing protein [Azonexus sp.]